MEDGAILGGVDLLAGEHGLDALLEVGLSGKVCQQLQGLIGDAVLGVVEEDAGGIGGEAGAARGVGFEEVAEMQGANGFGVLLKGSPGWAGGQRGTYITHIHLLLWARTGHGYARRSLKTLEHLRVMKDV